MPGVENCPRCSTACRPWLWRSFGDIGVALYRCKCGRSWESHKGWGADEPGHSVPVMDRLGQYWEAPKDYMTSECPDCGLLQGPRAGWLLEWGAIRAVYRCTRCDRLWAVAWNPRMVVEKGAKR